MGDGETDERWGAPGETVVPETLGTAPVRSVARGGPDSDSPSSVALVAQSTAERYEVGEALGKGGMGEVLEVLDRGFNRRVAMKTLLRSGTTKEEVDLFVAEAQINSQLEHPNLVPIHDIGVGEDGKPYFTMRLVRGHTSLKDIITRLKGGDAETHAHYTFERRVQLIQKVCHALAYAHGRGVVHCDIKLENIVVGDCGELFVVDWGISQLVERSATAHPHGAVATSKEVEETEANIYGTPLYMAPERMMSSDPATPSADIYSVAAVLYELLSLTHYLGTTTPVKTVVIAQVILNEPRISAEAHFDALNGRVPRTLSRICAKGLKVDPAERFQTIGALNDALQQWLEGRIPMVCPGTTMQRTLAELSRAIDRHPVAVPAAVVVSAAGLTLMVLLSALNLLLG
ncbi:MAG: serine/threonine-protein kinase [Myxococcota bacterium]